MLSKCLYFVILGVIFMFQDAACFFVKHVKTGMCLNVTGIDVVVGRWGNLSFVGLSNKCLDPTVQFRFLDNSAILNLETKMCFEGVRSSKLKYLPVLYLYLSKDPTYICRDIYHAVTQTSWGGFSIHYLNEKRPRCAVPKKDRRIANRGVDPYIGLVDCNDAKDERFNFGSVTCSGDAIKNANCPKDQYMVVKIASYRRLSPMKTCGLSDDYNCQVDATCLLKKQCDGLHECNITVNDTLFSGGKCPGSTKYLYFEYQCINTATPFNVCVDGVSLSHSPVPNDGFVKITTDEGIKNVCWQSLENAEHVVCRELGYKEADSLVIKKPTPSDLKDKTFSGRILCKESDTRLSQCSVTKSSFQSCSNLSYLKCHICPRPLLEDKQRFPDSSFSASASSKSRSPSDARISSGSSWCAPVANGKHYLQVDFGRLYVIYHFVTFGDTTSPKWVTTYNLNYTVDGKNWRSFQTHAISGNKYAYNDAAIEDFPAGITARALRFIPLSFEGQACMRIEICGATQFPDKPTNLVVLNIMSRSAEMSWSDPDNTGDGNLTRFRIKMNKENSLILNTTIPKLNKHKLNALTPSTTYEIYVAAGNNYGFGEEIMTSFTTSEHGGPCVLPYFSSGDITAKEGDLVNLLCSAQGEPPITFSWEKDKKPLASFGEIEKPHRCSVLVVRLKNQTSFGNYICHIRDQFQSTTHTISVQKYTEQDGEKYAKVGAENGNGNLKWFVGIIALEILLVFLIAIIASIAYLTYQNRRPNSSKASRKNKRKKRNISNDTTEIIQHDANSKQAECEESTYTALNNSEEDENDDHFYAHANQMQTGI